MMVKIPRVNSKPFYCLYSGGVTEIHPFSKEEGPRDIGNNISMLQDKEITLCESTQVAVSY